MDTKFGSGNLYSIVAISERTGRTEIVYFCNCQGHKTLQGAIKCKCQKQKPKSYKINITAASSENSGDILNY